MTSNVNKVLNCLIEKRLSDMQCGATSHGWMTIKEIAAQCGFEKNSTAVGCVVILMNKGIVETDEDTTLDGKIHNITESETTPILLLLILSAMKSLPRKRQSGKNFIDFFALLFLKFLL